MALLRVGMALALLLGSAGEVAAGPPKPEKIPVAFGSWTGPAAGTFKQALRPGLAKECAFVSKKSARVIIEGVVTEQGKGAAVRVSVKSAKSGEIVESREFSSPRPKPSQALGNKMARAVVEMARRAPTE